MAAVLSRVIRVIAVQFMEVWPTQILHTISIPSFEADAKMNLIHVDLPSCDRPVETHASVNRLTSPPRKRMRMSLMPSPPVLYFQNLPLDVNETIQGHLSAYPYVKEWALFVPPDHVLQALRYYGPLSFEHVDGLSLIDVVSFDSEIRECWRHGVVACKNQRLVDPLLRLLAARLKKFSFRCYNRASYNWHSSMCHLRVLAIDCRLIRTDLSDRFRDLPEYKIPVPPLGILFKTCGDSLRELYIEVNQNILFVASLIILHCNKLEILHLRGIQFIGPMLPVLRVVGKTLKRFLLYLHKTKPSYPTCARMIAEALPLVRELDMPSVYAARVATRVGHFLRVLTINETSETAISKDEAIALMEACPNAIVRANHPLKPDCVRVLGERLTVMTMHCWDYDKILRKENSESKRLLGTFASLKNLEELKMTSPNSKSRLLLDSFFFVPKTHLRKLVLYEIKLVDEEKVHVFDRIAKYVSSLVEFSCWTAVLPTQVDCLQLFRANRKLKDFRLFTRQARDPVADYVNSAALLIRGLIYCPSLAEVSFELGSNVKWSSIVADACVPLRGRRISLEVGGTKYLPA